VLLNKEADTIILHSPTQMFSIFGTR